MRRELAELKKNLSIFGTAKSKYKKLRSHLDKLPVGFPATLSGVELRILRDIFAPDEAEAALNFGYRPETFDQIYEHAKQKGYTSDEFKEIINKLDSKGALLIQQIDNETYYSLHPFIIGIFEMQPHLLNPGLYLNLYEYFLKKLSIEYLTTEIPQTRIIPVQKSISPKHKISTYDEMSELIEKAKGKIKLIECICRKGKDLIGDPCQKTNLRKNCLQFREFHDHLTRFDRGESISKKEALEILEENEKEGLLLMPSSTQEIQSLCSCCSCCCGILGMLRMVPRPVDFVATNFYAVLDPRLCSGCKRCMERCQMGAVRFHEDKASEIDRNRCIGCGLCVSTCKAGTIRLMKKEKEFVPPKDVNELHELLINNKKTSAGKIWTMVKAYMGLKVGSLE